MTTIGVVFRPQNPPERLASVAKAADRAGVGELWLWEDCFLESGIATASAALAWTERLRVGVGLMPTPLRNVALTAMEVATLDRLFPGRFICGVGHGIQGWMGQVGARVSSPLTLLGEYTSALRSLLGGAEVTSDGRYVRLDAVRLDWPPQTPPPVLAGGTGPKTLTLTGEAADGTILSGGTTPDGVRAARKQIEAGRAAAGRTGAHRVVVYLLAATGPSAEARLDAERSAWGFPPAADVAVSGDAPTIARSVQRWVDAGADTVVLQPTADEPDLERFCGFVGGAVQPLLGRA